MENRLLCNKNAYRIADLRYAIVHEENVPKNSMTSNIGMFEEILSQKTHHIVYKE